MAQDFMCQWGNCAENGRRVIVSLLREGAVDERVRFCCMEHAAMWTRERADRRRSIAPAPTKPEETSGA